MKKLKLKFFADPGHGWLRVKRQHLDLLEIASKITYYSYQRNDWVYLDVDFDSLTFMAAARAIGWEISVTNKRCNRPSTIRCFDRYRSQA